MVGPRALVAEGHRGLLAQEQRAVVAQPAQPPVEVAGLHLEMLRRVAVADLGRFLPGLGEDHLAEVAPGGFGGVARDLGQGGDHAGHDLQHRFRERAAGGDQPDRRIRPVLGLAGEVGGHDLGIGGVVGGDHGFGRAGDDVDADAPEEQPLGFGDEAVAGADDDVRRMSGEVPVGQGRNTLNPAQGQDVVGARGLHGVEDRRVDAPALLRRRGCDDVLDPGDLGGADAHDRRGGVGVAAAGHVAARRGHGDQALSGDQAVDQHDLELLHRIPLAPGEVPDPLAGEADVLLHRLRQAGFGPAQSLFADDDVVGPAVQALGDGTGRVLAAGLDLLEQRRDDPGRLRVTGSWGLQGGFQMDDGHGPLVTPLFGRRFAPLQELRRAAALAFPGRESRCFVESAFI